MSYSTNHISVFIKRAPAEVYAFASEPENLPQWASGLSGSRVVKEQNFWVTESPMGKIKIIFAETNRFGVLDHNVIMESGREFYNPMRVLKNDDGSEVVFTLYRQPEMADKDFQKDGELILKDLNKMKEILEKSSTKTD